MKKKRVSQASKANTDLVVLAEDFKKTYWMYLPDNELNSRQLEMRKETLDEYQRFLLATEILRNCPFKVSIRKKIITGHVSFNDRSVLMNVDPKQDYVWFCQGNETVGEMTLAELKTAMRDGRVELA
jgi:hypothetical protein